MTYINAVKYINAHRSGMPSPERMKLLCRYLGDPQRQIRFVHVAGGSGKTSCLLMLSTILKECGYKIGRLTSPFAKEERELISVDDITLSHRDFAEYVGKVAMAAVKMKNDIEAAANTSDDAAESRNHPKITKNLLDGKIPPEPIACEIICAAAFLAFRAKDCNIALLECGESRADPTGIIDPPLVSVVCGSTLTKEELRTAIGIIRRGTREVVSSVTVGTAYNAVLEACVKSGSRLTVPARTELTINEATIGGKRFEYRGKQYSVGFSAEYHLFNTLTVIETIYALRRTGVELHGAEVASGLARAKIPLRFEFISVSPSIILDCADSPSDVKALCGSMLKLNNHIGNKIIIVTDSNDSPVTDSELEAHGFSVIERHILASESDEKSKLNIIDRLTPDRTLLIVGGPSFVDRVKSLIVRFLAYR